MSARANDPVSKDGSGFGDDQFQRLMKASKPSGTQVPSLAALYEDMAPNRPPAFGDGALPKDTFDPAAIAAAGNLTMPSMAEPQFPSIPSNAPLSFVRVTSAFGLRAHPLLGGTRAHAGIDLAAPMATPIRATADGVVTHAGSKGGYGLLVAIKHGAGLQTRYGHMSRIAVAPGERVTKNSIIGYVGSTGRSTGPHLHYEVLRNGRAVNPLPYMQ
ncbi:M23 family metallopeptidase [Novosphingobium sp. RD2P27]|uniref:M23 family metallopeptidase n=1 Tax=Novosphingobium kalidii TaxID=3230299 RepID=A0ABV2D4V7_9SPHN